MGEAKIFLIPCETNILYPAVRIEVTDSGQNQMKIEGKPEDTILNYLCCFLCAPLFLVRNFL